MQATTVISVPQIKLQPRQHSQSQSQSLSQSLLQSLLQSRQQAGIQFSMQFQLKFNFDWFSLAFSSFTLLPTLGIRLWFVPRLPGYPRPWSNFVLQVFALRLRLHFSSASRSLSTWPIFVFVAFLSLFLSPPASFSPSLYFLPTFSTGFFFQHFWRPLWARERLKCNQKLHCKCSS